MSNIEMPELPSDIQGWMNFRPYYWRIANVVPPVGAKLVELGPWLGLSTVFLAQSLKKSGKTDATLYAIDTWKGSKNEQAMFDAALANYPNGGADQFWKSMIKYDVSDIVVMVGMDSVQAATKFDDQSIDFVFFDTEHTREHLSRELLAWLPKMKPGIFFGGHDIAIPGVHQAVSEHVKHWWIDGPCWEAQNI